MCPGYKCIYSRYYCAWMQSSWIITTTHLYLTWIQRKNQVNLTKCIYFFLHYRNNFNLQPKLFNNISIFIFVKQNGDGSLWSLYRKSDEYQHCNILILKTQILSFCWTKYYTRLRILKGLLGGNKIITVLKHIKTMHINTNEHQIQTICSHLCYKIMINICV